MSDASGTTLFNPHQPNAMTRKAKAVPFQARQGDVFLERVDSIPDNLTLRNRDQGRVILAYGEVTGHAHAIAEPDVAALYDGENGDFYLRVESATGLVHEEHARIDLPEGIYRCRIQREWTDEDEPRQVAD